MRRDRAFDFQPTTPYEVRCYRCRCSFAPGTPRCVHCGERIGGAPVPFGVVEGASPPATADDEARAEVPSFARGLLWLVSAGAAVLLSALQTCGLER
jgi:hypothetical protein